MTQEVKKFDAEVGKILHLMIHSLYANKEIFVRELISNASDACDKLRYLSQIDPNLKTEDHNFKITVKIDKDNKIITFRDNGIGMNKEDLISNLGTIARSGTQNFLANLSGEAKKDNMLIGQFGVGFYSSFMAADNIKVISRKAGESEVYVWESKGEGEYSVEKTDTEFNVGTEISLHIKPDAENFLDHFMLKHTIKTYSDHIAVPIYFIDEKGEETKLNSASALWTRSKSEISEEQYEELYKSLSFAADKPWLTMHNKNEGAIEFTNLLYIPSTKTFDLFHPDRKRRVKLYIKRVFISDENIDLIPHYLRFLRGVVDSEDLPLNISRETLQHNAVLSKINDAITKRVLSELKKQKEKNLDNYKIFWNNFGAALKEGLCEAMSDHEQILDACLFYSALQNKFIGLEDYIKSAKEGQKTIYYLSGEDVEKLRGSPQIEGFLSKGIDVLLFADHVDDFWVNINSKYKEFEIKSVTRADVELEKSPEDKKIDEENRAQYSKLINYVKETLGELVKDVKISNKLTSSPACLAVEAGAMDIRMERFLIEQKQLQKASAKILEINPKHKIFTKINDDVERGENSDEGNKSLVKLIFDQACIIEGEPVTDVSAFAQRMNVFLENAASR